jgi:hypothetical protein
MCFQEKAQEARAVVTEICDSQAGIRRKAGQFPQKNWYEQQNEYELVKSRWKLGSDPVALKRKAQEIAERIQRTADSRIQQTQRNLAPCKKNRIFETPASYPKYFTIYKLIFPGS